MISVFRECGHNEFERESMDFYLHDSMQDDDNSDSGVHSFVVSFRAFLLLLIAVFFLEIIGG